VSIRTRTGGSDGNCVDLAVAGDAEVGDLPQPQKSTTSKSGQARCATERV
jgi:hypothetical protein